MILQELTRLYDRRMRDPDPARRLPEFGLEDREIAFIIELRVDGSVVQLRDTRVPNGKRLRAMSFRVPQGAERSSDISASLLWDTVEYVLGVAVRNAPERVAKLHEAFCARIAALPQSAQLDPGLKAVKAFLGIEPLNEAGPTLSTLKSNPLWAELTSLNPLITFQLAGDSELICQRPAILAAALSAPASTGDPIGMCLVQGGSSPIERLHAKIAGIYDPGGQAWKPLVSVNDGESPSFASYGKHQGLNAPVGKRAAFAYATALNALLDRDSRNRVQVGDASTVFWAETGSDRPSRFDSEFTLADFFGENRDNPDRGREAVKALFEAVKSGQRPLEERDTRFFVLGLAPNAARISVRFWLPGMPFDELAPRIVRHFEDLKVVRRFDSDPPVPSLFRLLSSLGVQGKIDNVPPRLAGEWMRAILEGQPYPRPLLNAAVNRCKAEREVSYLRACVLKAWLNRDYRHEHATEHEVPYELWNYQHYKEHLDMEQPEVAYRLGRLFAALERVQEQAQPGINATIRDRYYGAASTTPVAVFTTLLRLKNAHLKKLSDAQANYFERLIGDILAPVQDFPRQLALPDQGRFALGYYHQRLSFYARKPEAAPESVTEEN